jgi:hypothetical protein
MPATPHTARHAQAVMAFHLTRTVAGLVPVGAPPCFEPKRALASWTKKGTNKDRRATGCK